jgi:UDP-GlcNAc:undecaprenyl-phosphate GlcNAc-1-phosphate transferase
VCWSQLEESVEIIQLIVPFLAAAFAAALATPLVSRVAFAFDIVDRPSDRKVNLREGIPVLGGFAVAVGCIVGLVAFYGTADLDGVNPLKIVGFLVGSLLLMAVGVVDDRFELNAFQKLPVQILAAMVAIYCGFKIDLMTNPLTGDTHAIANWIAWPLSLFWIVAVTNAMNLIDGLDGLSSGLGAIISLTLVVICWQAGQMTGVVIGVAMLGALLGYLPFNFPPARIFLGDTGALFIGFSLAVLSIQGYRKAALLTFVVPLLALAVPLLDTLLSVVRRVRMGKGIFSADKLHMHHRLLKKEGTQRRAVLWLYFQTACFSVIALSFAQLEGYSAFVFLVAVVVLTVRLLRNLGLFSIETDELEPADSVSNPGSALREAGGPEGSGGEKT